MQSDTFDQDTTAFLEWLKARGVVISPKIAIHDYRSAHQGRGIIAVEEIKEDEALFTIPRSAVMSIDADTQKSFAKLVPEIDELDGWMGLILYMIYHSGNPNSEFAPYFNVLPKEFSTLMFWSQQESVNLLKGSTLVNKIGKEEAERSFHERLGPIFAAHPDVFEGIDTSVDAFHRMGSLVMSYSFDVNKYTPDNDTAMHEDDSEGADHDTSHMSIDAPDGSEQPHEHHESEQSDSEGDESHEVIEVAGDIDLSDDEDEEDFPVKAMVPLADTLNAHSKLCNAHLCQESGVLVMRATEDIPKGAQVYNTYGDFPNGDLLRRYGYVEAGGTDSDILEITISDIVSAVELAAAQSLKAPPKDGVVMEYVNQLAEWEHDILEIVDDSYEIQLTGTPGTEILVLISFLTLAVFRNKDYKALKRTIKAPSATEETTHKILKHLIKSLAKQAATGVLFKEAIPIWQNIYNARIEQYPTEAVTTTTSDPVEPVSSSDRVVVLSHSDMATEVLAGEIRILKRCIEWINSAPTVSVDSLELQQKVSSKKALDNKARRRSKWT